MIPNAGRLRGALMVVAAMTLIPLAEGVAKNLMAAHPPLQVVWARFAAHFLLLAPFVVCRYRGKLLGEFRPRAQTVRGALMFFSVLLFMLSIAVIPLARAVALFAVAPFVVALFSFALLGERVRTAHIACIAAGFGGVLLIARPGGGFEWANLLAVGGGSVYAFYLLASRKLAGGAPAIVGGFFAAGVGALGLAPLLPFIAAAPWPPADIAAAVLAGGLIALAHYLLIRAFEFAPAIFLAPFVYWEIAAAAVVGALLHGDVPGARDGAGITLIAACGIALLLIDKGKKSAG